MSFIWMGGYDHKLLAKQLTAGESEAKEAAKERIGGQKLHRKD